MIFQLKILGSNAATPAYGRHQTSQLLTIGNTGFLIDCGEGCQMQLIRYKERASKISHILISHLHGDHFFGLIGLLNTMSLNGREQALSLYGPPDLADVITTLLRCSQTVLNFPLTFQPLTGDAPFRILEDSLLTVEAVPVEHRVPCYGFVFREKPKLRRINKELMPKDIRVSEILALKEGKDIYDAQGNLKYSCETLTLPPRRSRSYAYCADTRYHEGLIAHVQGVDMLYHEATFMHDQAARAADRYHSTTVEAATLARRAGVGQLLIGHFSSRYKELEPLLQEAQTVFPHTQLALEGQTFSLDEL